MKRIYLSLFLLLFLLPFTAFSQSLNWSHSFGSTDSDVGNIVLTDPFGDVIMGGYYSGPADWDPGTPNVITDSFAVYRNGYLAKYDPQGGFKWVFPINTAGSDEVLAIATDDTGNVYVTGYFRSSDDFDPGPGTLYITGNGYYDCYVLKINPNGQVVWGFGIGGDYDTKGLAIEVDKAGNVYVAGRYEDDVDFDPGPGTFLQYAQFNISRSFLAKYDNNGNFDWAFGFLNNNSVPWAMQLDDSANVYITGGLQGVNHDFDPGPANFPLSSQGSQDVFLAKYDSSGNFIWAESFGSPATEFVYDMDLDAQANIYLTGTLTGTVDFDPGPGTTSLTGLGSADTYLARYDRNGSFDYVKQIAGTSLDIGKGIDVTDAGEVLLTGEFATGCDFDPGAGTASPTASGFRDAFWARYDTLGNYLSVTSFGGNNVESGTDIIADSAGNVYMVGLYQDTVDFDPGPGTLTTISEGSNDIFLSRFCNTPPQPSTISGLDTVCQGATGVTFSVPLLAGASGYVWNLPTGANIITGDSTSIITVDFGGSAVSGNFSVSALNDCGAGPVSVPFPITVLSIPSQPGSIIGPTEVCVGDIGVSFSISPSPGATQYSWSLPSGASISSGSGSASVLIDFPAGAISGNLTVTATNSCGTGPPSSALSLTVLPGVPTQTPVLFGPQVVCEGEEGVVFYCNPVPLATAYLWTLPPGAVITNGQDSAQITVNFPTGSMSGQLTVQGTNTCGAGMGTGVINVDVLPRPNQPTITQSGNTLLSSPGDTYHWLTSPSDTIAGATDSTYQPAQSGTYYVVILGANGCYSEISDPFSFIFTSISPEQNSNWQTYPVPARTEFLIKGIDLQPDIYTLDFMNATGQLVWQRSMRSIGSQLSLKIPTLPLANGIYLLRISGAGQEEYKRIEIRK